MMSTFSIDSLEFVGGLAVLCTAFLYYYYSHVLEPYKNFPSHRIELKVLYWIISKKPVNSTFFQTVKNIFKHHESDGLCVIWCFKPYVFIFSEKITKYLINNPDAIDKPSEYSQLEYFLKDAVFTSNGENWRRMRALISPALHTSVVRGNIDIYNENCVKLVQKLKIADAHETLKFLRKCCTHAFIESIYGLKADSPENELKINYLLEAIEKISKFIAQRMVSPWLHWDFTLHISPSARKSVKLFEECLSKTREILGEAKENFLKRKNDESGIHHNLRSLAEVLLDLHIKDPSFSLEEVMNQTNSLTTTNSEGIALSLMWCLFSLGHHPDIQEKAFQEVVSVTGEYVAFDDLQNLKYVDCIMKESFRMYPVIPVFGRLLRKEVQCGKYKIPRNSTIIYFPYILHRNPDTYPDPEKFSPDRFMEPNSKINDCNYMPFAEGIRTCLGKNFTNMVMKVILCHLIRNFRIISLDRIEDVELSWDIVLTSSKNLRIEFVPRKP